MPDGTCTLPDCDKPRYQTREMCASHYMKNWRYGDPYFQRTITYEDLTGQRFGELVVIAREQRRWLCQCDCGETSLVRVGDLKRGTASSCGDRRTHHRHQTVTIGGAHSRVRSEHGPAKNHQCVDCAGSAAHWSYDHQDPDELTSPLGPYSLDTAHYEARCVPCHKRFDLRFLGKAIA